VRQVAISNGRPNVMPTKTELHTQFPRLVHAIRKKHGGLIKVAERMGMTFRMALPAHIIDSSKKKPMNYWTEERIKAAVEETIKQTGNVGYLPSQTEFYKAGYGNIYSILREKYGNSRNAATHFGLKMKESGTPRSNGEVRHWSVDEIAAEIIAFNRQRQVDVDMMPTSRELKDGHRGDLLAAIERQGGFLVVRSMLNLRGKKMRTPKPANYWQNDENLVREVLQAANQLGQPGTVPSRTALTEIGRTDLVSAMRKRGGPQVVSKLIKETLQKVVQDFQEEQDKKGMVSIRDPKPEVKITRKVLVVGETVLVHDVSVVRPAIVLKKHDGRLPEPYPLVVAFAHGDLRGETVVPYGSDRKHHLQWCFPEDMGDAAIIKF